MDTWSSVPWEDYDSKAVHKHHVPYKADANARQNLDVWIPRAESLTDIPLPSSSLDKKGLWVIYIHGGAWRDPRVTSASFEPTVKHLLSKMNTFADKLGGIASINYSLSPIDTPSKDAAEANDLSRQTMHPAHIVDVLTGIKLLQDKAGFGSNYILAGHSCGATLAFQVAMEHSRWGQEAARLGVAKPKCIIGLNGLYDMTTLIREPDATHARLKVEYERFTRQAFGGDEKVWHAICPISVRDWATEWSEGVRVILVQSKEDSLVPYSQLDGFRTSLLGSKAVKLEVKEMNANGDHNNLWEAGDRLAEVVQEAVDSL